jgi:hypothetical protein
MNLKNVTKVKEPQALRLYGGIGYKTLKCGGRRRRDTACDFGICFNKKYLSETRNNHT